MAEINSRWPAAPRATVKDLVDHIDYAVKLIGIDHVGISSDFDGGGGIVGWNSAAETFNVTLELVRRGYTEEQIGKIWSGNLLRVWGEVEQVAKQIQHSEPAETEGRASMTRRVRRAMLASLLVVAGWPSPGEARVVRSRRRAEATRRGGQEFRRRRPVRAPRWHGLYRGRPARSAEQGDREPRQGAAHAERAGGLLGAVLHPETRRRRARQPEDLLRREQQGQQARLLLADDPAAHRSRHGQRHQQPVERRRFRRCAAVPAGLRLRRCRMAGERGAGKRPALPEPAGRDGSRRTPDRRARPRRVRRRRGIHPAARRESRVSRLRGRRRRSGAIAR